MTRGDSQLLCPVCGEAAPVKPGSSGHRMRNGALPRIRACPSGHEFRTLERSQEIDLDRVMVQNPPSARQGLNYHRFDQTALANNIMNQLFGVLDVEESKAVAQEVTDRIDSMIDSLAAPLDENLLTEKRAGYTHFIKSSDVRDLVLGSLKAVGRPPGGGGSQRHRVAHVLYALSTLGNVNNRQGWRSASDVVIWLEKEYPDLQQNSLPTPIGGRRVERWWPPNDPLVMPTTVIKRHPKIRRRGGGVSSAATNHDRSRTGQPSVDGVPIEDFLPEKFRSSIEGALTGRPDRKAKSEHIAKWVLLHLVGQEVVLSSQLGAAVADCLRRVDDIAYLRWVTIGKELRVSWIWREARGLISHPSPSLVFDPGVMHHPLPPRSPMESA